MHSGLVGEPTFTVDTRRWKRQPAVSDVQTASAHSVTMTHVESTRPREGLPSLGSAGHGSGSCKPCVFLHTKGCTGGSACQFCHLCDADEKKKRLRAKRLQFQQRHGSQALQERGESAHAEVLMPTLVVPIGADAAAAPAHAAMTSRPGRFGQRPSLLQLPEDPVGSTYFVRNTFIETPLASPFVTASGLASRASSSCPASRVGEMQLRDQTQNDDAETGSTRAFTSSAVEYPQRLASMVWPATQAVPLQREIGVDQQTIQLCAGAASQFGGSHQTPLGHVKVGVYGGVRSEVPYQVRNTFIDTSCAMQTVRDSDSGARPISSCPASRIGYMQLTELSQISELDMMSMNDCGACEEGTPRNGTTMQWPATPEPTSLYEQTLFATMPEIDAAPVNVNVSSFNMPVLGELQSLQQPNSRLCTLSLADMIFDQNEPASGCTSVSTACLPSVGSAFHSSGSCKPCGFFHKQGCSAGLQCTFCHLCDSGEKKRRQREKREALHQGGRLSRFAAFGGA